MGQPITVPKPSGRPWDSQLLSQSHPDAHGTVNFTAQSHPDARGTACHTFGTAVDGHGNADGYGPDASGTQQAYVSHEHSGDTKAGMVLELILDLV